MLNPSEFPSNWRSTLRSLALGARSEEPNDNPPDAALPDDGEDAEREPFHLDDTELANRLVRDRGLIHYTTPPKTRIAFPDRVDP